MFETELLITEMKLSGDAAVLVAINPGSEPNTVNSQLSTLIPRDLVLKLKLLDKIKVSVELVVEPKLPTQEQLSG